MSTQLSTVEPPSIIGDMAKRYGMDKRAFEATIRQTCMPSNIQVSNEQFAAFLLVAKEYNLNPLTKEIYAFPAKGGGIQPIVSIDGWCNIINSHPQMDGMEFEDVMTEGVLTAIVCRIFRKDRSKPIICMEYMNECKQEKDTWRKWPARMLRHKSLIQCARYAFGFSGIVDPDEAERMEMVDVTPVMDMKPYDVDKTKPKTPFKNNSIRRQFCDQIDKEYRSAVSIKEIDDITEMRKLTVDAMRASGDERDHMVLEGIDLLREQMINRAAMIERDEHTEDEEPTFDAEEVPEYLKSEYEMLKDIR